MLLTKEEIKEQTKNLWKECFHCSEDFLEIYFEDKYTDETNITLRPDGTVIGAVQVFPYRTTLFEAVMQTGYISGLAVSEQYRKRGAASQLIAEAHRSLYKKNALLSFVIPEDEGLRRFYENEKHGAYWTVTYRKQMELSVTDVIDKSIKVTQPDDWASDLYVFYQLYSRSFSFMLHPSENDFYAALDDCELDNGWVLVARQKKKVVGICLAVPEADNCCMIRSLLVTSEKVKDSIIAELLHISGAQHIYYKAPISGSEKNAQPYAMARVIDVLKFLKVIAVTFPSMEMLIGVDHDLDIPENNGFYEISNGKVKVTDEIPDSIVTPGGLAAMFLTLYPTRLEMMLDE